MPGAGKSLWINRKGQSMRGRKRYRSKLATVKTVKKMIQANEEMKYTDVAIDDSTPTVGTGVVTLLTGVAQGDTELTREGNDIRVKSIHVRGTIASDIVVGRATTCRIAVVRWNDQTGGSLPSIGDIWKSDNVNAFRERDEQRSYQVVWDKTIVLPPCEIAGAGHTRRVDIYKKWNTKRRVEYIATGATIASAGKGHYFLVRMVNVNSPDWLMNIRVNFTG